MESCVSEREKELSWFIDNPPKLGPEVPPGAERFAAFARLVAWSAAICLAVYGSRPKDREEEEEEEEESRPSAATDDVAVVGAGPENGGECGGAVLCCLCYNKPEKEGRKKKVFLQSRNL